MHLAKVFKNGRSQALRLPKECRVEGTEMCVSKVDDFLIVYPRKKGWDLIERAIMGFTDDFMEDRNQPKESDKRKRL